MVEIHYHLGLELEAKKYAKILGYNYNSGDWFKQSYKILNREYDINNEKTINLIKKKEKNLFDKIIEMIR